MGQKQQNPATVDKKEAVLLSKLQGASSFVYVMALQLHQDKEE